MNLISLQQFNRNLKRFTEIVSVLLKYGLANWIKESDPELVKSLFRSSEGLAIADMPTETRIRMALSELGPTFIKLGQMLSTRVDLVGPALARELSELQANTPSDPPESVRATIEMELGKPVERVFAEFDDRATASASIGQIHQASLLTGEAVVVKVQHQGIEERISNDLDILLSLAELAEKHDPEIKLYQPRAMVVEFRRQLLRELDFRRELRNLQQFARNLENDEGVHIPRPYPELSARRVLTMERIEGFGIADVDLLRREGIDTGELARRGAGIFLEMVFRDGFYHADPHPGNIRVLPGGIIALLDCGMVGSLDGRTREEIEGMLFCAAEKDGGQLTEYVTRMGSVPQGLDRDALRADISEFLGEYVGRPLIELDLSRALTDLTEIIRRYRIILPSNVALLVKVLVMLEGTSRSLDRNFSLADLLQPYYVRAMQRRFSPGRLLQRIQRAYVDWDRLVEMFPRELSDILRSVRDGKFDIHLEHRRVDTAVNRLVYGILCDALFLGSCLILSGEIPPLFHGISIPGSTGILLSFLLGFRLLRAIRRSGDLAPDD